MAVGRFPAIHLVAKSGQPQCQVFEDLYAEHGNELAIMFTLIL